MADSVSKQTTLATSTARSRALPLHAEPAGDGPMLSLAALASANGNRAVSSLLTGGAPLPPQVLADMEARFRQNFSDVRIHDDARAHASAAAMHAKAYTHGSDIVFNTNRFAPYTGPGKRLLAHELAHVVQQRRGGAMPTLDANAPHEAHAQRAADAVAGGASSVAVQGNTGVGMALDREDDKKKPRGEKLKPDSKIKDPAELRKKHILQEFDERAHDPDKKVDLSDEKVRNRSGASERARHADRFKDIDEHHGLPKFLGGNRVQTYIKLTKELHYLYHEELYGLLEQEFKQRKVLDADAKRNARRSYGKLFARLDPDAQKEVLARIVEHAEEFDKRYAKTEYPDKRQRLAAAVKRGIKEAKAESKAGKSGKPAKPAKGAKSGKPATGLKGTKTGKPATGATAAKPGKAVKTPKTAKPAGTTSKLPAAPSAAKGKAPSKAPPVKAAGPTAAPTGGGKTAPPKSPAAADVPPPLSVGKAASPKAAMPKAPDAPVAPKTGAVHASAPKFKPSAIHAPPPRVGGRMKGVAGRGAGVLIALGLSWLAAKVQGDVEQERADALARQEAPGLQAELQRKLDEQADRILTMQAQNPFTTVWANVTYDSTSWESYVVAGDEVLTGSDYQGTTLVKVEAAYAPMPQQWHTSEGSAAQGGSEDHEFTTTPLALEQAPFESLIAHAKANALPLDPLRNYCRAKIAEAGQASDSGMGPRMDAHWREMLAKVDAQ